MLAALIAAGVGELAAPALAATATAAPVVASTAAPLLMAAPAAEAVAAPLVAETLAAPVAEGIATGAQAATPLTEGAVNPALTQAGPAPQLPQGIERAVDTRFPAQTTPPTEPAPRGMDVWNAKNVYDPVPGMQTTPVQTGNIINPVSSSTTPIETASSGLQKGFESALKFTRENPLATTLGIQAAGRLMDSGGGGGAPKQESGKRKDMSGFNPSSPSTVAYNPVYKPTPYAEGGIAYAVGGPVEQMSAQNAIGGNTMYPQSQLQTSMYSNPMVQRPMPSNVINSGIDTPTDPYTGEMKYAEGGVTGNGNLNLNIPLDLGASGIAQGGAGGYSAAGSGGQNSTLSTATGAPSQTAQQPPVAMAPAATAEPLNIQPRGNSYMPTARLEGAGSLMGSGSIGGHYTVGDQAADDWVKAEGTKRGYAGRDMQQYKQQYQDLYNQYYKGYAKGGTTSSEPNYAEMMGARSDAQRKADEEYLQAYAKKEMSGSINTDSDVDTRTKDPLNASLTSLKKIGKRVGIKPVDLPKSNATDSNVFHAAANGGIMHGLGGYSDGGRLLRGPGDGVSDSIPATIGNKQPARLADGEFVVPARIVSELGNGSTEAGARKLYEMMERVQASRKKSIGKGKVAVNSKSDKHLPK